MADPSFKRSLDDVPDILPDIFSYLDPIHYSDERMYEARRSLAMAARSCRDFAGPALDVLWRRLPDDQPLADLLYIVGIAAREHERNDVGALSNDLRRDWVPIPDEPGFMPLAALEALARSWKLWRGYNIKYVLQVAGDPCQHRGWPRFMEYASRVRTITLFAFDGPAWCSIWTELRSMPIPDDVQVLPKLASVAFCDITRHAICPGALALITLSPSVRKLNFSIASPIPRILLDEILGSLFSQIFTAAPGIENLRLEIPPSRPSEALQRHCSRVHYLEVSSEVDVDFGDLLLLTQLPNLQYLSISLSSPALCLETTPLTLRSVTTLVVEGAWVDLRTVLDALLLPSLRSIAITGWYRGDPAAELAKGATECFRAISRHTSLTSLSMSTSYGRLPLTSAHIPGMSPRPEVQDFFEAPLLDIMGPLLSLSALRSISLDFPEHFVFACTSADLRAISESWPTLEALHLLVSHYRGDASDFMLRFRPAPGVRTIDPTRLPEEHPHGGPLEAIVHFARNCPRLRVLHLSAMEMGEGSLAAVAELLGTADPPSREAHGLRTLVVPQVRLPPRRIDLFAKILELVGAVFPHAKCTFGPPRRLGAGYERWVYGTRGCPVCERDPKLPF